jgi:hypothetical protein
MKFVQTTLQNFASTSSPTYEYNAYEYVLQHLSFVACNVLLLLLFELSYDYIKSKLSKLQIRAV